jgi:hypothetical protein
VDQCARGIHDVDPLRQIDAPIECLDADQRARRHDRRDRDRRVVGQIATVPIERNPEAIA